MPISIYLIFVFRIIFVKLVVFYKMSISKRQAKAPYNSNDITELSIVYHV